MKLYIVKLENGEYLRLNFPKNKSICAYTRGQALKKAAAFSGKIERLETFSTLEGR